MHASTSERLRRHQQEHLLQFWDDLTEAQQQSLSRQIDEVDFDLIASLMQAADPAATQEESPAQKAQRAVPPAQIARAIPAESDLAERRQAKQLGEAALRDGKVGMILVAGGQGTRLDFPYPKGMFPIGPVSGKTLFQILAEQVLARSRRAGVGIPYYVMTSDATHAETVEFFRNHSNFGLNAADVFFFKQGNMPAVDAQNGKLLLAEKHELSCSPDGHGGMLAALSNAGLLDDMARRGIEYLFYHQVDNPLARVGDPEFVGLHILRNVEISTKVVAKRTPEEKMGLVVDVDGQSQIIEYSDLPAEIAARRDANDELLLWAGNTAIHLFSRSLLDRLVGEKIDLPFHRAHKKVPYISPDGERVKPEQENAFKFERFIFDALPLARGSLVVETTREGEFTPLKNKTGECSPDDVKQSLTRLHAGWLRATGAQIPENQPVEISPLYALDAEEAAAKVTSRLQVNSPTYLDGES